MIGTLGSNIIFEVSDDVVLTLRNMKREVSGRWTEHETMGEKPKAEFLGAGLQTVSFDIQLSATLGVRPRAVMESIEAMIEHGTAEYLIIGNKPVGRNPFRLLSSSEEWNTIYNGGQLARAMVSISLGEYT